MSFFDVYNTTLWNIVLSINNAEQKTCSLQIIRSPTNYTGDYYNFDRESLLMNASVEMMVTHFIPLLTVDYTTEKWDMEQPSIMTIPGAVPIMTM